MEDGKPLKGFEQSSDMVWLYFNQLSLAAVLTIDYRGKGENQFKRLVQLTYFVFYLLHFSNLISNMASETLGYAYEKSMKKNFFATIK